MEDRDDLHRPRAAVLERVLPQRRQVDARAGGHRLVLAVDVQRALTFEHVDHLVVDVAVIRRAAWGDHAEELGQIAAADLVCDEIAKLAVAARRQRRLPRCMEYCRSPFRRDRRETGSVPRRPRR